MHLFTGSLGEMEHQRFIHAFEEANMLWTEMNIDLRNLKHATVAIFVLICDDLPYACVRKPFEYLISRSPMLI